MTAPMQQKHGGNPYRQIYRQPAQNNSSTNSIPPFGLVRVVGTNADGALLVDQPNQSGQDVYINGPTAMLPNNGANPPRGGCGVVTKPFPIWAQYDPTSGTPAIGQVWGPASGSYLLTSGKSGFLIQGNPVTGSGPSSVLIASNLSPSTPFSPQTAGGVLASAYMVTGTLSPIGLSLTIPTDGNYVITANLQAVVFVSSVSGGVGAAISAGLANSGSGSFLSSP